MLQNNTNNFRRFMALGLFLYVLLLARLIIFKFPPHMTGEILRNWSADAALRGLAWSNYIPFRTILDSLFNASLPVQLPTLIYNIAAFVPLGFLVSLIASGKRPLVIVLIVACGVSVLFELVQVLTLLGTGDIDDVILNTLGAAIGYGIFAFLVWCRSYIVRFTEGHR